MRKLFFIILILGSAPLCWGGKFSHLPPLTVLSVEPIAKDLLHEHQVVGKIATDFWSVFAKDMGLSSRHVLENISEKPDVLLVYSPLNELGTPLSLEEYIPLDAYFVSTMGIATLKADYNFWTIFVDQLTHYSFVLIGSQRDQEK